MSTSQREKCEDAHIIALVELNPQKMRVRIALAREGGHHRRLPQHIQAHIAYRLRKSTLLT